MHKKKGRQEKNHGKGYSDSHNRDETPLNYTEKEPDALGIVVVMGIIKFRK